MSCSQSLLIFASSRSSAPLSQCNANALRHPSTCLDNWMKHWADDWPGIWQGRIWQGRGRRELFWHRTSLTWAMATAHAHPMYFDPHCFIASRPIIILCFGIQPAWPDCPLSSPNVLCRTLHHHPSTVANYWPSNSRVPLSYIQFACLSEFAQKSPLNCSRNFSSIHLSHMYPTDAQHQHPQSYKDGKAEHRGSLEGA